MIRTIGHSMNWHVGSTRRTSMDYQLDEAARLLRTRLRELIAQHFPEEFLGAFTDNPDDLVLTERFCKVLAHEGLLARSWPVEFGGGGGSVWEQTVVREEMWAHHEPRGPQYMGLNWVGPAMMRFGSPEQQAQHLAPIAAGEVIWCQGFSEPEAGSDLASLRTRATPTADGGWSITGQKIWTSYARLAQWCVLAARTSTDGPRQRGITLFLLPMDRPGITARAVHSMLGNHHLNEVFFDDVAAGPDDVLGHVDDGWTVIREALRYERVGIARYARCERLLALARVELGEDWHALPAALRARWTRALIHLRAAALLAYRVVAAQAAGTLSDADASMARVATTQCDQEVAEILMEALGGRALDGGEIPNAVLHGAVDDHWRYAQAATISSGTIEIQRMLIARSLLQGAT
jgi:alkylation response protein AidB-like acyl-CoA dehydrogenase